MFGVVIIIDRLLPKVKFCIVSACVVFVGCFFVFVFCEFYFSANTFFFLLTYISKKNYKLTKLPLFNKFLLL